jgi:hypothetical protein
MPQITELLIEGLKGFIEAQSIPLTRLTLLVGPNSSGKSSIIQSILLLKQTIEETSDAGVPLLTRGKLTDLGSMRDLLSRHDTTRPLRIGAKLSVKTKPERANAPGVFWWRTVAGPLSAWMRFHFSADAKGRPSLDDVVVGEGDWGSALVTLTPTTADQSRRLRARRRSEYQFRIGHINGDNSLLASHWEVFRRRLSRLVDELKTRGTEIQGLKEWVARELAQQSPFSWADDYDFASYLRDIRALADEAIIERDNFLPISGMLGGWSEDNPLESLRLAALSTHFSAADVAHFAVYLGSGIGQALEQIRYLAPLREFPSRYYVTRGSSWSDVGKSGEHGPDLLNEDDELAGKLNEWLTRLSIRYQVNVQSFAPDVYALGLRDSSCGVDVTAADVGFGISQVLPVLIQSLFSKEDTIIIEQPELHLHPRLQAELGTFFAERVARSRNSFVIETHSEHIILRLQALLRRKAIPGFKHTDVSVVYVDSNDGYTRATPIPIAENGDFEREWPDGFFPERLTELL